MDLRMVKTRAQIKQAFLTLREKLTPEKIKVKDICEMAQINKTTFYHHYTDSMELSNEIDDHAIDQVISGFEARDRLFDDPKAYFTGLLQALERESANIKLVFRGKQEILCTKLEDRLQRLCSPKETDLESRIRLSFAIGGFVRIVKDYLFGDKKYDSIEQLAEYATRMVEALLQHSPAAAGANG